MPGVSGTIYGGTAAGSPAAWSDQNEPGSMISFRLSVAFSAGLRSMSRKVREATGVELHPEPVKPLAETRTLLRREADEAARLAPPWPAARACVQRSRSAAVTLVSWATRPCPGDHWAVGRTTAVETGPWVGDR